MHHFVTKNVHTCAHFCYTMVHCGMWDCCIVQQVYSLNDIIQGYFTSIRAIIWLPQCWGNNHEEYQTTINLETFAYFTGCIVCGIYICYIPTNLTDWMFEMLKYFTLQYSMLPCGPHCSLQFCGNHNNWLIITVSHYKCHMSYRGQPLHKCTWFVSHKTNVSAT